MRRTGSKKTGKNYRQVLLLLLLVSLGVAAFSLFEIENTVAAVLVAAAAVLYLIIRLIRMKKA
jgi:hypothetical protein